MVFESFLPAHSSGSEAAGKLYNGATLRPVAGQTLLRAKPSQCKVTSAATGAELKNARPRPLRVAWLWFELRHRLLDRRLSFQQRYR
jgi:hypothetical protein